MIVKTLTLANGLTLVDAKLVVSDIAVRRNMVHAKYDIYSSDSTEPVSFDYIRFDYAGGNVIEEVEHKLEKLL